MLLAFCAWISTGRHQLVAFALVLVIWCVKTVLYRLYFHPLAGFPGPKHVAASRLFEILYDLMTRQYYRRLPRLHEKYGRIIRIAPNEVHIADANFYDNIYAASAKRRTTIPEGSRTGIGLDGAHSLTLDHEMHRERRRPVDRFYNARRVEQYETRVLDPQIEVFIECFRDMLESMEPVGMENMYTTLSANILSALSFPKDIAGADAQYGTSYWFVSRGCGQPSDADTVVPGSRPSGHTSGHQSSTQNFRDFASVLLNDLAVTGGVKLTPDPTVGSCSPFPGRSLWLGTKKSSW
ncbi:uncharacterized protein LTR77_010969 [Saxophila tyrrhenica]|uniref:Cytochrome P450 n=1 Tax=Saxophila tyrrhenica TaxID=1690608 RepID=A0AAV9NX78_9PEZI|nr:hypothetical protein LTR77_010969 [Saxophila tyrrhenica]